MKALRILTLLALLSSTALASKQVGDLTFATNFDTLMAQAKVSQKTVVIKFYTDWCKWCKVMSDSTLPDPYVQKFLKNFEMAELNAEVDTITAARYGVRSYPTTVILKPNGVEIDRLVGYYPPVEFVTGVVNAMSGIGTIDDYLTKLADRPDEIDLMFEIGQKYRWRGDYDRAASYFSQIQIKDPGNTKGKSAESAYNLAHMRFKLKDYSAAIALWKRMLTTFPNDPMSLDGELMIPYCYQQAEDFKSAKKEYNAFLQRHPDTEEKEWIAEQFTEMDKKK
jgi:tetratricopeptide (TPR) repeat protein